ncbi:MAG TPA: adenylosuccinate lyase [Candidatus Binatia bacterium]|nr:adenylosuccinate lyase [Candidatus Binatia bacterium]
MGAHEELLAVTPLDGRYADKVAPLQDILSEYGLIKRRVAVEVGWLTTLADGTLPDIEPLDDRARFRLATLVSDFGVGDAMDVKKTEKTTNHDVKAVEIWLRSRLSDSETFQNYLELIHFGATSEDVNNLAYGMQLRDTRDRILQPGTDQIASDLEVKAERHAGLPMLARTHGQPATPTTMGKELRVFSERLRAGQKRLGSVAMFGKFNGATGNYNAMMAAYPEVNWPAVTAKFVRSFGFEVSPATTQIEPHDWTAVFASEIALNNTVMTDLSRDMWTYISMGYFTQEVKAGEVSSSTMPHKVNPIDFENAEANFGVANALFDFLARKLPISRLQRDLSDSSALRSFGEAFGHTLVAQQSLKKGMGKVHANPEKIASDLESEWSVLTEAVQTVMRRYGIQGGYDAMKAVSRGKAITKNEYHELVEGLDLPEVAKSRLLNLTPATYIGAAPDIARQLH